MGLTRAILMVSLHTIGLMRAINLPRLSVAVGERKKRCKDA